MPSRSYATTSPSRRPWPSNRDQPGRRASHISPRDNRLPWAARMPRSRNSNASRGGASFVTSLAHCSAPRNPHAPNRADQVGDETSVADGRSSSARHRDNKRGAPRPGCSQHIRQPQMYVDISPFDVTVNDQPGPEPTRRVRQSRRRGRFLTACGGRYAFGASSDQQCTGADARCRLRSRRPNWTTGNLGVADRPRVDDAAQANDRDAEPPKLVRPCKAQLGPSRVKTRTNQWN